MTSYSLDAEKFIKEVEKYPEIWDLSSVGNFRYRTKKNGVWAGVARSFIPDFDSMSEPDKNEVYHKLHGKWRNIRDAYVRDLRRKNGRRGYIYDKQLAFLNPLYKQYQSQSDEDGDEDGSEEEVKNTETNKTRRTKTTYLSEEDSTHLKRRRPNRTHNIEFVDTPTSSDLNFQIEDEDRSFFNSLLPAVREFSLDQKLEFRTGVLQILKTIRLRPPLDFKHSPRSD